MKAAVVLAAILAVPGSRFQVPGSCSGFGSQFAVLCSGFVVQYAGLQTKYSEPRTKNNEPRIPNGEWNRRTRTWNPEPGTWNLQALPDRESFLREAREALGRSQEVWHRYSYKERRTDVHVNPFGRMGTSGTRVLEIRPSPNPQLTYKRVIERNGTPVSQQELDRQDADYRAHVVEVERRAADASADEARRREQEDVLARRRAQLVINDVLNTLQFELVRRDVRDGRPAIVVAFTPKPDARPATRQGRIARVFKGHAWVDEATREVTAVEAVAVDDVAFGGFIAKLYEGTRAILRRDQIEPGVWMPTRVHLSGDVRALFRKTKIDYVVEWFDYRRLPTT